GRSWSTRSPGSSPRPLTCMTMPACPTWRWGSTRWCARCWGWPRTAGRGRPSPKRRTRRLLEAPVPFDLIDRLVVLDLPGGGPLLEVLDPLADLGVDLFLDHHVALEDVGH